MLHQQVYIDAAVDVTSSSRSLGHAANHHANSRERSASAHPPPAASVASAGRRVLAPAVDVRVRVTAFPSELQNVADTLVQSVASGLLLRAALEEGLNLASVLVAVVSVKTNEQRILLQKLNSHLLSLTLTRYTFICLYPNVYVYVYVYMRSEFSAIGDHLGGLSLSELPVRVDETCTSDCWLLLKG
jgi:hypothetical protein